MLRRLSSSRATSLASKAGPALAATSVVASQQQRFLVFNPRVRDYQFLLEDCFDMYKHYEKLGLSDNANKDLVDPLLEECAKISTQTLFPLYQSGDDTGCVRSKDGDVTTPKGYKEAYKAFVDGGWQSLSFPEEYGGQGLPYSVGYVQKEIMATANWPFVMYPGLSGGAAITLQEHGDEEQKKTYLTKLVSGEWSGTMCLTEPQCGTDLAQVKTKAVPTPNEKNEYLITGTKIFISAGEHDLCDNIIHIVLAKLPNAPEGTKGISLFVVPKYLLKPDGTVDKSKKNVTCAAIESKMGIKASATAQLSFENSVGYLVGEPHTGMAKMFTFMNTARIGTAIQGVASAELAFQNALAYARERTSMRSLSGTKEKDKVADLIIHHPNVKHNVLFGKAIAEGGRALVLDMCRLVDNMQSVEPSKRKKLDNELGFLTPIAKGCLTELGLEAANLAVQVYGGHGYIKGNGVEQIVRDCRIATLYEGTTGIQALDLIGRKVLGSKENYLGKFLSEKVYGITSQYMLNAGILGTCSRHLAVTALDLTITTQRLKLLALKDRDNVGAASQDFLMACGYVVLGYYWLKMASVAQTKIDAGKDKDGFYQSKVDTCDFYFTRIFPRYSTHKAIMTSDVSVLRKPKNDNLDL